MSGLVLDTNIISELRRVRPNLGLKKWIELVSEQTLFLSCITLSELRLGIELVAEPKKRRDLERWLVSDVVNRCDGRILSFDQAVAGRWGRLEATARAGGAKLPAIDSMIAATALHYNLSIVTRNERDFGRSGVAVVNPWE